MTQGGEKETNKNGDEEEKKQHEERQETESRRPGQAEYENKDEEEEEEEEEEVALVRTRADGSRVGGRTLRAGTFGSVTAEFSFQSAAGKRTAKEPFGFTCGWVGRRNECIDC